MSISDEERATAQEVFLLPRDGDGTIYEKSDEEIEFEKFREELKDGITYAKINVYRQPTGYGGRGSSKKLTFLLEIGFDEFSYSQLAMKLLEDYGTGTYRLQARDADGILRMNRAINVEAPKKDLVKTGDGNMAGMMREFSAAMAHQTEMMRDILGPQTTNQNDPIDQMTKMMAAMGAMMGAMGIQQAAPKTMVETLAELKMVKELVGDLGGGDSGGDGNLMGLLTATVQNLGPILGLALKAGQQTGEVNDAGIIQPQLEGPKVDIPVMTDEQQQLQAMKPQLEFLIKQAKGEAEPFDVAQFVLKAIPDEQLENVEMFLHDEKCIEKCVAVVPEIANHKKWFDEWRDAMINGLAIILDADPDGIDKEPEISDLTDDEKAAQTASESDAGDAGNAIATGSTQRNDSNTKSDS